MDIMGFAAEETGVERTLTHLRSQGRHLDPALTPELCSPSAHGTQVPARETRSRMGNKTIEMCQLEDRDSEAAGLEAPGKASWHMQASRERRRMSGHWPFSDKGHQAKFYTRLDTIFLLMSLSYYKRVCDPVAINAFIITSTKPSQGMAFSHVGCRVCRSM